jgi:hypothetical protein
MTLNITNYNPEVEDNLKNIDQLMTLLNELKTNISTKMYKPYQNFLERLNKYITFISQTFQKELEENKETNSDNENADDDSDIETIASISEYEDYETIDIETQQIKLFEDICRKKYKNDINSVFEVDIIKICN